ncbi:MAG: antibiotic biosynthesis monooxygenase [Nitrospirae bacterium]|nr:antibiotic biosynthesis monooxygenase [Nitrospirota bacterium]
MIVTSVTILVKKENVNDFIEATKKNHKESIKEHGNMRFDFLQSIDNPCQFLLYEAYESIEASKAHKDTAHYIKWRDTVADWMEKPRQGVSHKVISPIERDKW